MLLYCFVTTSHGQKLNVHISGSQNAYVHLHGRAKYTWYFLIVTWSCYLWVDEHEDQPFWSLQLADLCKRNKSENTNSRQKEKRKIRERERECVMNLITGKVRDHWGSCQNLGKREWQLVKQNLDCFHPVVVAAARTGCPEPPFIQKQKTFHNYRNYKFT